MQGFLQKRTNVQLTLGFSSIITLQVLEAALTGVRKHFN